MRAWARRGGVHPPQERECPLRFTLSDEQPGQQQVLALARVAWLVAHVQPSCRGPLGGLGELALGEQQPHPFRAGRVEQVNHVRAGPDFPGFTDRRPGGVPAAKGQLDPGEDDEAFGQRPGRSYRPGPSKLPAACHTLGRMLQRGGQLVPLVQHCGHAKLHQAQGRLDGTPHLAAYGQGMPVIGQRSAQPALGAQYQAMFPADSQGQSPTGRAGSGLELGQDTFGLAELTFEPERPRQVPLGVESQPTLTGGQPVQHRPHQADRGIGVAAQAGQVGPHNRQRPRHIRREPARLPAGCLLLRGIGRPVSLAGGHGRFGDVEPTLDLACLPGHDRLDSPQRAQPRQVTDLLSRQAAQPPSYRRALTAGQRGPAVPLDQPGRPGGVPGGKRMPHCVVGQLALLIPGRGGAVQPRQPLRPLLSKPDAQQVGEQRVVAPPAAHLIQRGQEQVGPFDRLQQPLAI